MQLTLQTRDESYSLKLPAMGADERKVFDAIQRLGRADLHQLIDATGLDKSAVSARRNGLMKKGLIKAVEKHEGKFSKPVAIFELA